MNSSYATGNIDIRDGEDFPQDLNEKLTWISACVANFATWNSKLQVGMVGIYNQNILNPP